MKIWLNEQYAIENSDGNNVFGKGNDNFDFVEVYIPTAVYEQDNVIPVFIFERADKKKYGEFAHNVGTWQQDGYTVFKHVLNGFVLAQKGNLDITIKLNFLKYVDEKRFIEKTKNVYVQGVVLNAIVVENEAFILSDDPEAFLTSLKYLLNDLNARIEAGDFTASNAIADRNNNIIDTTYETKADAQTKLVNAYGHASTLVNSLESTVSNTYETKNSATAKLNEAKHHTDIAVAEVSNKVSTLQSNIENGTVVANNANEAVSYRDDENNLVVIKDKIEDILYLINDVTGADLTGLQSKINALEAAWNNFMNGSESDDVIDTLNEIRNELASLDSASKKALYNLGAYDTVSGNTITRKTGRFEINDNTCSFAYYDSYCVVVPLVDLNASENLLVKCNRLTSVYDSDVLNNIYRLGASDNRFAIIGSSMSMTSDNWKSFLSQAPLYIEYELSTSYEEEIIENQPLITLDSQGSKWLTDEWKKGLNKLNPALFNNRTEWNTSGNTSTRFYLVLFYTNSYVWSDIACEFQLSLDSPYGLNKFTFSVDGRNNGKLYGVIGINGNTQDDKNLFEINLSAGTYTYSVFLENASINRYNVKDFMISDGDYPYEPYNASKHITNAEAEFLKEESLKSAQLWDEQWESGGLGTSGEKVDNISMIRSANFISVKPNTTYTINTNSVIWGYDSGKGSIGELPFTNGYTFTTPSNCYYLRFRLSTDYGTTYKNDVMLNKGSKAQPYHEFEGEIVRTKELEEFKSLFDIKEIPLYAYMYESKEYYCFEASPGVYKVHLYHEQQGVNETITIFYDGKKNSFSYPDLYLGNSDYPLSVRIHNDYSGDRYGDFFHFGFDGSYSSEQEYTPIIIKKCTKIL